MERPANALSPDDLRAESQKWVTLSNGKAVLIARVGIADVLKAAMSIPDLNALVASTKVDRLAARDPVDVAARGLREAEVAERVIIAGVLEPRLTLDRKDGTLSPKDFAREDQIMLANAILALSGYSVEEAVSTGGSSGSPE